MPHPDIEISSASKPIRYRFHPLVRFPMLAVSLIAFCYTAYFIFMLIPRLENVTLFFKIVAAVVLYVSGSTLHRHLTSLNTIIIRPDSLELRFILRKRILIPWNKLLKMDIFKVITHYWRVTYTDDKGNQKIYKTSLAFPSIMQILISIHDHKPDVEMNEMLSQILEYKRRISS